MKLYIYSVYDSVSQAYGTPFLTQSDETAIRLFSVTAGDPSSLVYQSPGDFSLYKIGDFHDDTAIITPENPPVLVSKAINLRPE